ncbi:uncharacterized protein PHALS_10425 [Plasmopara halstedii]|uniref:Uncharacterized protein n=1 Tax=Plasmopara halstedii TaxID=4781 RepID=A0A0P1AHN6_PLAHL|nr:uncharacterized protein PHALS_10425 [Plasmopara halstedii]CEG40213.1 hypothetical protein PHALS_10425 [Plasmopara halstedii]|eukprot:XP_024576582.1 hypothetical protein PHALS_10425 [Plasmopara halstedii]
MDMLGMLLGLLILFVGFAIALFGSARLRKGFFIWFSYATITGWYYFRVLQKKYTNTSNKAGEESVRVSSPNGAGARGKAKTTSLPRPIDGKRDTGLVYFEPRDMIEQRQQARPDSLEHSGVSDRSSRTSDAGSSASSDGGTTASKRKRRLFRSRRKDAAEEAVRRVSDTSSIGLLTVSGVSDFNGSVTPIRSNGTRRTYTGRKKPPSWAD